MVICRAALAGVRLLVVPVDPVDEIPRRFLSPRAFLVWLDEQVEKAAEKIELFSRAGLVPPAFGGDVPDLVDNVRIVAGAHPYGAAELDSAALGRLDELLASTRCVGVGEIGLDFGPYNELSADVQEAAFRRQLRVAHEHAQKQGLSLHHGGGHARTLPRVLRGSSQGGHADALSSVYRRPVVIRLCRRAGRAARS